MTLPKNITDAIESLASAAHHAGFAEGGGGAPDDRVDAARAALEAAIAAAIQQVEPPTDAEVEAWERLRERVQKEADNACEDYSAGLWRAVELIDEERGAGR